MRALAHFLLNPLTHFWLVLLIGLFFFWRKRKKAALILFAYSALWLFIISVSPLPDWLAFQRESRYAVLHQIPDSLKTPHIIVLGGGHIIAPSLPPNDQLSETALARLCEGIRLYRQQPGSKLICSGFSASGQTTVAEILAQTAVVLGVPPQDTLWSPTPANTEAEAYAYASRFGNRHPLILVTDAIHIPRALFWFRQAGLSPIAAPTNHYFKPSSSRSPYKFKPSVQKIIIMDKLIHEWAGMVYAKTKVWSIKQ